MNIIFNGTYKGNMPTVTRIMARTYRGIELIIHPLVSNVVCGKGKFEMKIVDFTIADDEDEVLYSTECSSLNESFFDILKDVFILAPAYISTGSRNGDLSITDMGIEDVSGRIYMNERKISHKEAA